MFLRPIKISADTFIRTLNRLGIPYLMIGAIPVGYYTQDPRFTQDLDFTIALDIVKERFAELVEELDKKGIALTSSQPTAHELSTLSSVRFMDTRRKTVIDLVINPNGFTFDDESARRIAKVKLWNKTVNFPAPEDLIVMKLARGEPQDLKDVEKIIARRYKGLDWKYIRQRGHEFGLEKDLQRLSELFNTE